MSDAATAWHEHVAETTEKYTKAMGCTAVANLVAPTKLDERRLVSSTIARSCHVRNWFYKVCFFKCNVVPLRRDARRQDGLRQGDAHRRQRAQGARHVSVPVAGCQKLNLFVCQKVVVCQKVCCLPKGLLFLYPLTHAASSSS